LIVLKLSLINQPESLFLNSKCIVLYEMQDGQEKDRRKTDEE